jgi:2-oxo-3-hexenedioate decarboxylase
LEKRELENIAKLLHEARLNARPVTQLSKQNITLTRDEAYQVQEAGLRLREAMGEKRIGLKMGLTSEGKRRQMNLDSPLYGELTSKMKIDSIGRVDISKSIHAKIEPEIAFMTGFDLDGDVTREQVLEATQAVCACLEILDSRYEQFKYFSMEDVIADNSSSSHFVTGPWVEKFKGIDLRGLNMKMSVNGELVHEAVSSEISGDPVVSVIELCRLLKMRGRILPAGSIVLAGAATAAVPLQKGMIVKLEVDSLPELQVGVQP